MRSSSDYLCDACCDDGSKRVGTNTGAGSKQSRSEGVGLQITRPDSVEGRSDRGEDGGLGGGSFEAGTLRGADEMDSESHEPSALASERPVHHSDFGDVVGGHGTEIRSRQDGSDAGRHFRHAFWETNSLRRREGLGGRAGDCRGRAGYSDTGGNKVSARCEEFCDEARASCSKTSG